MKKFWLNDYGKLAFQNKENKYLFAERSYQNIDKIIYIDESRGYSENAGVGKFSEFKKEEWIPITKTEFNMVKHSYREIVIIKDIIKMSKDLKKTKDKKIN